jgi:hypothetical protein
VSRRPRWTLIAATLALAVALVALAHPHAAGSDVFGNVGPASQLPDGSLVDRYPLGHYYLDTHFDAVSASLTGGVDVSGVPPMIAGFLANALWEGTAFLARTLISLFTFAFSLDLLNGSRQTGGAGALAPVSLAIHSIYASVFGAPWLVLAVTVVGMWAMWRALVQRRYTETAGALGLSLVYLIVALAFVAQPGRTIGSASHWTNQMSASFLSIAGHGSPEGAERAKQEGADQLFLAAGLPALGGPGVRRHRALRQGRHRIERLRSDLGPRSPPLHRPGPGLHPLAPARTGHRRPRGRQDLHQQRQQVRLPLPALLGRLGRTERRVRRAE